MRIFERDTFKKAGHEKDFTPTKNLAHVKATHSSSYENLPHGTRNKKNYRTADGEVIIEPVNFLTMNAKKGRVQRRDNVEFGGVVPYKEDDYNIRKKLSKSEMAEHKATVEKEHEGKAFYMRAHAAYKHANGTFT